MFPRLDGPDFLVGFGLEFGARSEGHTNSLLVIVEYDALHISLNEDMEIWELSTLEFGVDVGMSCVLALSVKADVALGTHGAVDRIQNVVVRKLWPAYFFDGGNEVVLQRLATIIPWTN